MGFFRRLFCRQTLQDHLREKKTLKIRGIRFVIKKIELLDHLEGANILAASYDTYKIGEVGQGKMDPTLIRSQMKKMRQHYADVILAGTVHPRLTRKPEAEAGELISIDELLRDWDLATDLFNEIIYYSYGKKKLLQGSLPNQN